MFRRRNRFQRPSAPVNVRGEFGTIVFDNTHIPIVDLKLKHGSLILVGRMPPGERHLKEGRYGVTVYDPDGEVIASAITTCAWDIHDGEQAWMELPIHITPG